MGEMFDRMLRGDLHIANDPEIDALYAELRQAAPHLGAVRQPARAPAPAPAPARRAAAGGGGGWSEF